MLVTLTPQDCSQAPQQDPTVAAEACAPHFDNVRSYWQSSRDMSDPSSLSYFTRKS